MTETKDKRQPRSLKRKLGNTAYTVKAHFSEDTDKTFQDRVQKRRLRFAAVSAAIDEAHAAFTAAG